MRRIRCLNIILFIILALAAQTVSAGNIRVMPLGDSDTSGFHPYLSYRYDLWFLLVDAGFDVDFVGGNRNILADTDLYPRFDQFDADHEGQRGQVLAEMVEEAQALIQEHRPHVVLWKGSHDICTAGTGTVNIVRNRLRELIDIMRAEDPGIHFVLATPYDWYSNCEPDAQAIIPDVSREIADVASVKDTPGSRVLVADHYTGWNIETMYDTFVFHGNRLGEMFMAEQWFGALQGLLPTIEVEPGNFEINAGLNDAWFNPATPGQGFFVTVFPDIEMMFLAWFTYDTQRPAGTALAILGEPGHRWLTAFGPFSGNTAELDIELTSGGVFDSANPVPGSVADGTIRVEFDGCNDATVRYNILSADVAGAIPVERIALDNVPLCEALAQ